MTFDPEREERLMASVAHASILFPFIGIIVPILIWLTQRERSALLRFQAMQATAFQGFSLALYVLAYACQFASMFALFALIPLGALLAPSVPKDVDPGVLYAAIPLCFSAIMLLLVSLQCLVVPGLMLLGLWAARQILRGQDYLYPVLGKRLVARLAVEEAGTPGTIPAAVG